MADSSVPISDSGAHVTLRALEGVVLEAVSPAGTSEPVTDMFVCSIAWETYTP